MKAPTRPHELSLREQTIFFLPLGLTSFLIVITHSLFNAGLARLPSPEVMIAAFAVAKSLMHIFQSPTMMIRQTVTSLIDHRKNFKKTALFIASVVLFVVMLLAVIAFSGLSRFIFREIMGLRGDTLEAAIKVLQVLFIFPAVVATRDFFGGFSIKFRTTPLNTLAAIVRSVFVLIYINMLGAMQAIPAPYLAGFMFLGAVIMETLTMLIGHKILNRSLFQGLAKLEAETKKIPKTLGYRQVAFFFAPLMATQLIHTTLMPIINGGLARTHQPEIAVSAFAVGWSLGMIVISPINLFHQVPIQYGEPHHRKSVRRFALLIALGSFTLLVLLAFTDLGLWVLQTLIGATPTISLMASDVLKLMCVLPFLIMGREFYWGTLMRRRTTKIIWQGKILNWLALVSVVLIGVFLDLPNPAIVGILAMIACELVQLVYLHAIARQSRRQDPAGGLT